MSLIQHLEHFGLSEKEAKVYISSLELGASPVQSISRKAGVNRATTYVQIASLIGRGLMSSYEQGKKRFFVAESPDRLVTIYEDELHHLQDKEDILKKILPDLRTRRPSAGLPKVRLFEGHEGLESVRQELLQSKAKEAQLFAGVDYYNRVVPEHSRLKQFERLRAKNMQCKVIHSTKGGLIIAKDDPERRRHLDRRVVDGEKYDVPGELAVFDNKIVLLSYKGDPIAVLVESAELAQVLRSLYDLAWAKVKDQPAT